MRSCCQEGSSGERPCRDDPRLMALLTPPTRSQQDARSRHTSDVHEASPSTLGSSSRLASASGGCRPTSSSRGRPLGSSGVRRLVVSHGRAATWKSNFARHRQRARRINVWNGPRARALASTYGTMRALARLHTEKNSLTALPTKLRTCLCRHQVHLEGPQDHPWRGSARLQRLRRRILRAFGHRRHLPTFRLAAERLGRDQGRDLARSAAADLVATSIQRQIVGGAQTPRCDASWSSGCISRSSRRPGAAAACPESSCAVSALLGEGCVAAHGSVSARVQLDGQPLMVRQWGGAAPLHARKYTHIRGVLRSRF